MAAPDRPSSRSKKSESSQRVLEEATESFHLQLLKEEENGDKVTVERLTSDISPVIRLVDSTIYTAIRAARATSTSRRRTSVHEATASTACRRKPCGRWRSSFTARYPRIKVMAELDIAE
jgi:hypothetical protein